MKLSLKKLFDAMHVFDTVVRCLVARFSSQLPSSRSVLVSTKGQDGSSRIACRLRWNPRVSGWIKLHGMADGNPSCQPRKSQTTR